jgi:uncharacterized NAD(P)/FAD-binding protein YdhS
MYRHRLLPCLAARPAQVPADGRPILRRAIFLDAIRQPVGGFKVRLRRSGGTHTEQHLFHLGIDPRSIWRDVARRAAPVIWQLLNDGLAQVDPSRLEIVVDAQAMLLSQGGSPVAGVSAIRPISRAATLGNYGDSRYPCAGCFAGKYL